MNPYIQYIINTINSCKSINHHYYTTKLIQIAYNKKFIDNIEYNILLKKNEKTKLLNSYKYISQKQKLIQPPNKRQIKENILLFKFITSIYYFFFKKKSIHKKYTILNELTYLKSKKINNLSLKL